jgi:hypothetical protein
LVQGIEITNNLLSILLNVGRPQKEIALARGAVHTVRRDGVWVNEVVGDGVASIHRTKDEAAAAGRELAMRRQMEHLVHNMDGTIGYRNSYGNDPYPPPG